MLDFLKKSYYEPGITGIGVISAGTTALENSDYEKFYFAEENISTAIDILWKTILSSNYTLENVDEDDKNTRKLKIGKRILFTINKEDTFLDLLVDIVIDMYTFGYALLEKKQVNEGLFDIFKGLVDDEKVPISDIPNPVSYYHLPARYTTPNIENGKFIGWKRVIGNNTAYFKHDKVVLFKLPSLFSTTKTPKPPSECVKNSAAASMKLTEYNGDFFDNNATPRLHIDIGKATDEQLGKAAKKFEEKLKGQPHRNIVTKGGVKITPTVVTNKDMEFSELDDKLQQKILAKYGIMPGLVGKNIDDLQTQFFIFKTLTVNALHRLLANRINRKIMLGPLEYLNLKFKFRPMDTLDKAEIAKIHETYLKSQVVSPNEVRFEIGKPNAKWGDNPIIPWSNANQAVLNPSGETGQTQDGQNTTKQPKKQKNDRTK